MTQQQIDGLMILLSNKIPLESIGYVREQLTLSDKSYEYVLALATQMKDPTLALILSILMGYWGIDRVYIGNIGLGILKLFTGGGLGI